MRGLEITEDNSFDGLLITFNKPTYPTLRVAQGNWLLTPHGVTIFDPADSCRSFFPWASIFEVTEEKTT